ncbi:ActS/PrrB/RegB family redox-sensitive histidine kinase [Pseudorhodoplanes sp.]|jgi:two-component system sensor histidine kinase RegB|uniref:ActS/PrrB/RegB family redox-sensitive histidine kinase n=1 Tax=Pseudorhodoplanes sp. TaxID=1934341 RepID=UPI002C76A879|nr:ActS/PrrB/RegB family redox-sensitive histidine kinase [Pseudorhodoplanes sp.]HWV40992.1 ActS/PrrB/RegB family redox-sensitive histidine kinase [Pseudorhodoplanes sp.]
MSTMDLDRLPLPRRNVRLDTLVRLRWLSIIGQTVAVLVVYFGFEFDLPIYACLAVIVLSAWLNIALRIRFQQAQRLEPSRAAWLLAFDIGQLGVLMYLTGGLDNPFSFFFLGPVLLSATALPARMTILLGLFATFCATMLFFYHEPLPWSEEYGPMPVLPNFYMLGVWFSIVLAIFFISIYAWQISEESRQLVNALAATELVLAREQHLTQIDGLAAAAAHALGTPLSTISVIARELERELEPGSPQAEDVRLLREQAQRCRDILAKLNELQAEGVPFDGLPLSNLLDEVAEPHRHFGIAIEVKMSPSQAEPVVTRNPAILYGLGNLVENAVDFARERVEISADWTADTVSIVVADDGPGFAPEVIGRIGEPYVRSRRLRRMYASGDTGMGLGFFIAKTLLERTGARLTFVNRPAPESGAIVSIRWPRRALEFAAPAELEPAAASA